VAITIGQKLGAYEVVSLLGKGGMGEVYRARDSRLKREVAIKVLPEAFVRDPERLARFQREAEVLASLNHSNIAAIHDLEEAEGTQFLVLELVEGETLAERIAKGGLPTGEALDIAGQIAEALEAAHEKGVIHRDLKPANIKVLPGGRVKVLDFGLAKVLTVASHEAPTMLSQSGEDSILGTPAYMSPEQARGKTADERADIWAFGCVLYEMLAGRRSFPGDSSADIIASVVKSDPDWSSLPEGIPPPVKRLLRRCLQKDPNRRLRHIADAKLEVDEAASEPAGETVVTKIPRRGHIGWMVATAVLLVAAVTSWVLRFGPSVDQNLLQQTGMMKLNIPSPGRGYQISVSPDGRRLAYVENDVGRNRIWIHEFDGSSTKVLEGIDDASIESGVFWGPDSQSIGYSTERDLKRASLQGGLSQLIASREPGGGDGDWNSEGVIVFSRGFKGPLYRVSASGGTPEPVTTLDSSRGEFAHRYPQFLPDGRRFIYLAQNSKGTTGVFAGSLDSQERTPLLETALKARYASGFLLFLRDGLLQAQRFDEKALKVDGAPFPIAQGVGLWLTSGWAGFDVSENGVLVYTQNNLQLDQTNTVWFNRKGDEIGQIGERGGNWIVNLSPDDRRVAINRLDPRLGTFDVWIYDRVGNASSLMTRHPADEFDPQWSPDSSRLAFSSNRKGYAGIFQIDLSTGRVEDVLPDFLGDDIYLNDWSKDDQYLLAQAVPRMYAIPLKGDRKALQPIHEAREIDEERFSPDVKWIAYNSNDSGKYEVWVVSFPKPGRPIKVSSNGGTQPRWRRDGKELFYLDLDGNLMSVEVRGAEFGTPTKLFKTRIRLDSNFSQIDLYDVTTDGQQFIMLVSDGEVPPSPVTVVLNWWAALQ
jgi:serine/threonine protein kinase